MPSNPFPIINTYVDSRDHPHRPSPFHCRPDQIPPHAAEIIEAMLLMELVCMNDLNITASQLSEMVMRTRFRARETIIRMGFSPEHFHVWERVLNTTQNRSAPATEDE